MEQIIIYDEFKAQLAELKEDSSTLVFDYEDSAGNKEARSHVYKLRQTKSAVDKARKEEKKASLDYGREVDSQAKEITLELEEMIEVHQKPLDEIEQREKDRVEAHENNIKEITSTGEDAANNWMDENLQQMLKYVESFKVDDFEEFAPVAAGAKDRAITSIKESIEKREKYAAEQAELEQMRKEKAEREQKDHEEQLRKEGEERAKLKAEAKAQAESVRVEAERKAETERVENERFKAEQEQEREKQARLGAELRATQAEERAAREIEEAAQKERDRIEAERLAEEIAAKKREANKAHKTKINNAVLDALVLTGINKTQAKKAVTAIAKGEVPYTTISY